MSSSLFLSKEEDKGWSIYDLETINSFIAVIRIRVLSINEPFFRPREIIPHERNYISKEEIYRGD